MLRNWRSTICWSLSTAALLPAFGYADCGDITKKLLGVEIGGPRTYVKGLPTGISLKNQLKQEWPTGGVDTASGKSSELRQLEMQAKIHWHENRVALVLVFIQGPGTDVAAARERVLAISGVKEFYPPPSEEFLRCGDGLMARVNKIGETGGPNGPVPLLVLLIEHPQLKKAMLAATQGH
jgi:hypothetical protein